MDSSRSFFSNQGHVSRGAGRAVSTGGSAPSIQDVHANNAPPGHGRPREHQQEEFGFPDSKRRHVESRALSSSSLTLNSSEPSRTTRDARSLWPGQPDDAAQELSFDESQETWRDIGPDLQWETVMYMSPVQLAGYAYAESYDVETKKWKEEVFREIVKTVLKRLKAARRINTTKRMSLADAFPPQPLANATSVHSVFHTFPQFLDAWGQTPIRNLAGYAANRLTVSDLGYDPHEEQPIVLPALVRALFPLQRVVRVSARSVEALLPQIAFSQQNKWGTNVPKPVPASLMGPSLLEMLTPAVLEVELPFKGILQGDVAFYPFAHWAQASRVRALDIVVQKTPAGANAPPPKQIHIAPYIDDTDIMQDQLRGDNPGLLPFEAAFGGVSFGIRAGWIPPPLHGHGGRDELPGIVVSDTIRVPNAQVLRFQGVQFEDEALADIVASAKDNLVVLSVVDCVLDQRPISTSTTVAQLRRAPNLRVVELGSKHVHGYQGHVLTFANILGSFVQGKLRSLEHIRFALPWQESRAGRRIYSVALGALVKGLEAVSKMQNQSPPLSITLLNYSDDIQDFENSTQDATLRVLQENLKAKRVALILETGRAPSPSNGDPDDPRAELDPALAYDFLSGPSIDPIALAQLGVADS